MYRLSDKELEGYLRVRISGMWFQKPVIKDGAAIFDKYADQTRPALAVFERSKDHKKPHVHLCFAPKGKASMTKVKQAVRTFMNRLGYKGNKSDHYVKEAAPNLTDQHFTYLCKGVTEKPFGEVIIVARTDYFTYAVINERNRIFWDVNKDIVERAAKKRKKNPVSPSDAIFLVVKEKFGDYTNPTETELIRITIDWFLHNKKLMNSFYMKSVVTHVACRLDPDSNRIQQLMNEMRFKNF